MTKMIRLGARLRAARKAAGFHTSKEFLKKYKIPASTYSQYESGARIPDDDVLKFYCTVLDVNFDWLKLGKGLPYKQANSKQKSTINEELVNLSSIKNETASFNCELLAGILEKLLHAHGSGLSENTLKTISKEASDIYKRIISSTSSATVQIKLLKAAFTAYK